MSQNMCQNMCQNMSQNMSSNQAKLNICAWNIILMKNTMFALIMAT